MSQVTALALFSGGLDSILACRVIADQGVRLQALKFVTPFFDHHLLEARASYAQAILDKYGLKVEVVDLSAGYLPLLAKPAHGFGRNFNPCIDCKILMLRQAREMMAKYGASFLVTGEVLGQRPMSQRRDAMRVIERDADCRGILLRPLSARLLPPTQAEETGLVSREALFDFSGRSRKKQIALAQRLGICDYPNPAGGCMLTDVNLSQRIKQFYNGLFNFGPWHEISVNDIRLLAGGRQFRLAEDIWFIVGRTEQENKRLLALREQDDWLLRLQAGPSPQGLLRYGNRVLDDPVRAAALLPQLGGLIIRYSKSCSRKNCSQNEPQDSAVSQPAVAVLVEQGQQHFIEHYKPINEEEIEQWRI